jgi:phenylalanyl-tRNA synthetase beta chain
MKLPINWLKDYIDVPADQNELMAHLTSIGHMQDGPPKEIAGDVVYDLEIRQNRSDCLSILGLAREAAASLDIKIKDPTIGLPEIGDNKNGTEIIIDDPKLCYRFNTVTISNLTVKESPLWLKNKLEAYGIKSINSVVDITNFVMVELGQPLHAYDKKQINNQKIVIRRAQKGEQFTALGNKKINLTSDDLIIADDMHILAMAGIIGGEQSGVTTQTNEIVLEDATYNQARVRRSSLAHSLRTEASTRHEKFLHPKLTEVALKRAVALILEICGGTLKDHTDIYPHPLSQSTIAVNMEHVRKVGGISIGTEDSVQILERLQIPVKIVSENELNITVPYFRTDIEQEADIIEEILRINGYDKIPDRLPSTSPPKNIQSQYYQSEEIIKDILTACGYNEQITDPLVNESHSVLDPILLQNSLNSAKTMLRTTLKNNLLNVVDNQKKYKRKNIRIFEVGKIYYRKNNQYVETPMLGVMQSFPNASYFDLKGILEHLLDRCATDVSVNQIAIEQINRDPTFFFEIELKKLLGISSDTTKILTTPPQEILQDFSLFVSDETNVGDIIDAIKMTSQLVYKISLGEQPQIKDNKKSVFLKLSFHNPNKEITNADVEIERQKILDLLKTKFTATIR